MSDSILINAVKASSAGFGNYIDPTRELVDFPHLSLVEVDLPEYERNGLGRALLKVVRYEFVDINRFGVEGMSVGANSSRGHVVYADMNPKLVGQTHSEAQDKLLDKELLRNLYLQHLPIELITLAALNAHKYNSLDQLLSFLKTYNERSSWMEIHPVEVRFSNIEALTGCEAVFDWDKLISNTKD